MGKKNVLLVALLAVLVVFSSFTAGIFMGRYLEEKKVEKYAQDLPSVQKVAEVLSIINHGYVEPVSDKKLIDGAVNGMIKALDDPYTHYQEAQCFSAFNEEMSGHFYGIGVNLSNSKSPDGELVVEYPIPGTPAEKAGIEAKDIIAKIGDKSTKGMDINTAVKLIRGDKGTKVSLTIKREGVKNPMVFDLVREQINLPNVFSKKLDNDIGYIQIYEFNGETSNEVKKQYDKLKSEGIKGLILDLRNNPGGMLDEAVNLASLWIPDGPIVKTKSRTGHEQERDAIGGADTKMPLVVLVNKGSASASEIVSGALQDYGRAVIVGETTFGKACVQSVITLSDGSGLLLTTERYYTPKGRMIQKKGIKPDIVVKFDHKAKTDAQLNKAEEVIREFISGKRQIKIAKIAS